MKRCITLVAAAALILGLAATASAELAVKAAGAWRVSGQVLNNFTDNNDDAASVNNDTFTVRHRMRTQLRFVYNENVMGELYTEYGNTYWGQGAGAYGAQGALNVKRAFIQFRWPETDVLTTVGEQDITFPSSGAFSNMVQGGNDGGAIAVSSPITDNVGLTLVYTRLLETTAQTSGNNADVFLAAVPVKLEGMKLAPWAAYGIMGQNSGAVIDTDDAGASVTDEDTANVWWVGLGFNMDMLDPIVIYADFMYGSADEGYAFGDDSSGWLLDAMVEFKGLPFATLQGFGAYSSGNDLEDDGTLSGDALPIIDSDFTVGGSMINGSAFGIDRDAPRPGFWLIGAAARKISFIEKLSHDVIVMYAQGTGDAAGFGPNTFGGNLPGLTKDDSYLEVDFNTRYQIYESLAAIVELGYGKPNIDDTDPDGDGDDDLFDDATMKAAFGFLYAF